MQEISAIGDGHVQLESFVEYYNKRLPVGTVGTSGHECMERDYLAETPEHLRLCCARQSSTI